MLCAVIVVVVCFHGEERDFMAGDTFFEIVLQLFEDFGAGIVRSSNCLLWGSCFLASSPTVTTLAHSTRDTSIVTRVSMPNTNSSLSFVCVGDEGRGFQVDGSSVCRWRKLTP